MNVPLNIVVDELPDCYLAYAVSTGGVALGMGHTYEEAVADVLDSMRFCNTLCKKDLFDMPVTPELATAAAVR